MKEISLTDSQKKFIANLVSTGENQVDYLEATQFAIESWYLGFPQAQEDPIYCQFREYFMKRVLNIETSWRRRKYQYDNARYSNILCDYVESFYDEIVNDKYKDIKAFTYGFLDEYHSSEDGNAKYNGHDWECSFDEYCFEMADTITDCLVEKYSREEIFHWGFWKHWDDEEVNPDRFATPVKKVSKRKSKK